MLLTFTKKLMPAIVGCMCLFSSSTLFAVSILPGGSSLLNGTTAAANPDLGGVVIRDQLIAFEISNGLGDIILTGDVQDRVVRSTNTGELIFAPRLRNLNAPGADAWINRFSMVGFDGFTTDIDFRTDGLGDVGPDSANRSVDGNFLNYRYSPSLILPPDEGLFLSVVTDAQNFDLSGIFIVYAQNDFGAGDYGVRIQNVSAPSAVPLPAAVWLFGSGLIGLMGIGRRQFKTI